MDTLTLITYIAAMALTTYFIRMLPLTIFRKKIESRWIKSFLFYLPFAVLGAMTIPDIFYSTGSVISAAAGLVVALVLAVRKKGLLMVAITACITVYVAELIMKLI